MIYSKNGLHLTEQFESCRLVAYQDSKGIWTIGWGHTFGVYEGLTCTRDQADAWLLEDIQSAAGTVNRMVTVSLTQDEFDALTDFVFNAGSGNFSGSTMLRLLNQGNYAGASEQFEKWDHSGGVEIAGLLRRRKAEEGEFNGV